MSKTPSIIRRSTLSYNVSNFSEKLQFRSLKEMTYREHGGKSGSKNRANMRQNTKRVAVFGHSPEGLEISPLTRQHIRSCSRVSCMWPEVKSSPLCVGFEKRKTRRRISSTYIGFPRSGIVEWTAKIYRDFTTNRSSRGRILDR